MKSVIYVISSLFLFSSLAFSQQEISHPPKWYPYPTYNYIAPKDLKVKGQCTLTVVHCQEKYCYSEPKVTRADILSIAVNFNLFDVEFTQNDGLSGINTTVKTDRNGKFYYKSTNLISDHDNFTGKVTQKQILFNSQGAGYRHPRVGATDSYNSECQYILDLPENPDDLK